jgi:hypothetical protein
MLIESNIIFSASLYCSASLLPNKRKKKEVHKAQIVCCLKKCSIFSAA